VADGAAPASVKLEEKQIGQHVHRAMQELPETQRTAIVLCHYQGMRNIEAAAVMGVSVEALESLLARGRRGLRASLSTAVHDLLGEG
jgi:RNA polymerase sigma-70 factor (ECF subfamily)